MQKKMDFWARFYLSKACGGQLRYLWYLNVHSPCAVVNFFNFVYNKKFKDSLLNKFLQTVNNFALAHSSDHKSQTWGKKTKFNKKDFFFLVFAVDMYHQNITSLSNFCCFFYERCLFG